MFFTKKRPLRVGTDCSGMDAPIVALQQLKIPFSHEFSSEIDKHCLTTIKANFAPKLIFGDMTTRKLKDIPDIDLYVCGFPCQPFSVAGKREGVRDPRGTLFWECVRVIRYKKPVIFVLENVRGLLSIDQGETFKTMLSELKALKRYSVYWKVLNTADYGIPQSRKRVFFVGILKKTQKKDFVWPTPIPCRPLEEFVDWNDKIEYEKKTPRMIQILKNVVDHSKFINLSFGRDSNKNTTIICPTITIAGNMWCVPLRRYASITELSQLQGFDQKYKFPCSTRVSKRLLGNTISVNVLVHIFKSIFETME